MDVKLLNKKRMEWTIGLESEDHTFVNLLRELCWEFGGEAAYRTEHPLLGNPQLKVAARSPKKALRESADKIVELAEALGKEFEK